MKATLPTALLCLCLSAPAFGDAPVWRGYAGNAQHQAQAPAKAKGVKKILWSTPVDLAPGSGTIYIHYGSPMITASNTVLVPVKTTSSGAFQMTAYNGQSGKRIWKTSTDYAFAPHDWVPSFPAHITAQNRLYYAGAGGTVYYRDTPDMKTGASGQLAFFGISNYLSNKSTYDSHVMINGPITADEAGDIYFSFVVTGSTPLNLKSGIARIGADGTGSWISAGDAAGDKSMVEAAQNCAPAVSADQSTIYITVTDGGGDGELLGLDSSTLKKKYKTALLDPTNQQNTYVLDDSSASPTIGPDGDVYYGVIENDFGSHNGRGWLLHFSADLTTTKTPGSFGWDDTASIVPTSMVPSYTGSSPYLLMSKYNNYLGGGDTGDGKNKIAILDPDATQKDEYSDATVMKEIMTLLGPTPYPGGGGAVYEWCINSAVVDVAGKAIIANSEDGHTYRWDLVKNKYKGINLNRPIAEAYTPTLIGPDGTIYAINDAILYALGK